jgi:hypothetical protein
MKTLIAILAATFMAKAAFAGDNGYYLNCSSASGKTQVIMGQYRSYDNDIAMLSIMGKTLGEMHVDSEVSKNDLGNGITRFTELDHDGADLLTVQQFEQTEKERRQNIIRARVLSGYNVNKMAPLDITIDVTCKIVYNPI